jgi:nicotinamide mononucleotide (NMN) deamidase PncC
MPALDSSRDRLFEKLARQPIQIAMVCTGGGSGAIASCFRRAGASRNFVDAAIPYSRAASEAYLGVGPADSRASLEFAQQLAAAALARAVRFGENDSSAPVGIALVAALPTEPPSDVEERIHVALHRAGDQQCWSENLDKGMHSRESAEAIADQMVFQAIAYLVPGNG